MLYQWFRGLLLWALVAFAIALALSAYVRWRTKCDRYTDLAKVPVEEIAIIFGAGVWEDGTPCPMLAARVQAGVALYKMGRARKLLMTGDRSSPDYDEVKAMQLYAEKCGVPRKDIILDPAGFSTYESCYRARKILGVNRAILITQRYHLPRAIYTARHLGIKAIGLGIPDWGKYLHTSMSYYTLREIFATIKALWDVRVTRPRPTFEEPFEGMW